MFLEKYKSEYNNNKFKTYVPTWNGSLILPDQFYSVSVIQYYFDFIIKKAQNFNWNPLVQIYLNKIKNKIVFKKNTGYKLESNCWEVQRKFVMKINIKKTYQN